MVKILKKSLSKIEYHVGALDVLTSIAKHASFIPKLPCYLRPLCLMLGFVLASLTELKERGSMQEENEYAILPNNDNNMVYPIL